jgi:hypothetical protein
MATHDFRGLREGTSQYSEALEADKARLRQRLEQMRTLLGLIAESSIHDPGESDLDDEQPVTVHLTLKEVRFARRLLAD